MGEHQARLWGDCSKRAEPCITGFYQPRLSAFQPLLKRWKRITRRTGGPFIQNSFTRAKCYSKCFFSSSSSLFFPVRFKAEPQTCLHRFEKYKLSFKPSFRRSPSLRSDDYAINRWVRSKETHVNDSCAQGSKSKQNNNNKSEGTVWL